MRNAIAQQITRDRTLDYLFQIPTEEQFESLRLMHERSNRKSTLINRVSMWFKGEKSQFAAEEV